MHLKNLLAVLAVAGAIGALPAQAMAADDGEAFNVVATITACGAKSLTIAAQIEAASDESARAVRSARLKLRFEAAPLLGRTRRTREIDLGPGASGRRSERFSNLRAQSYSGIVRYRWVRGSRTVERGMVRTRNTKAGGRRGKAFCSVNVGRKPSDKTPPKITPVPADAGWKRGPLTVNFLVSDDFSGVALVASRVDAGPFVRGRSTRIDGEGSHTLLYFARDAAGNQSRPATVTLRVDQNAPTPPAVTGPSGATSDTSPDITWNASSDSASGVAGYVVLVRDANGAIVWSQNVPASAPTAITVGQALAPGSYTAQVVAYDRAAPQPFTATGAIAFTVVPPNPGDPPPDGDGDGVADASDNCPSVANANQANSDGDARGDTCDNCPTVTNADQADVDGDGAGNHCDDSDGDTLTDHAELTANPQTAWSNPDTDGDGDRDDADDCPTTDDGLDLDGDGCPP